MGSTASPGGRRWGRWRGWRRRTRSCCGRGGSSLEAAEVEVGVEVGVVEVEVEVEVAEVRWRLWRVEAAARTGFAPRRAPTVLNLPIVLAE